MVPAYGHTDAAATEALGGQFEAEVLKGIEANALTAYSDYVTRYILDKYIFAGGGYSGFIVDAFKNTFKTRLQEIASIAAKDPPLADVLAAPSPAELLSSASSSTTANVSFHPPGAVMGTTRLSATQVNGALVGSWQGSSNEEFDVSALNSPSAQVTDSNGHVLGSGNVTTASATPSQLAISGDNTYSVSGTGSLSFYGSAESNLAVSGNWLAYSATITGNISITVTTSSLTLNGATLLPGTYTITASVATLAGVGTTGSPNFAGSATITAAGGALELGPGSGTLSVGGAPIDTANGTTLTGYNGTVTVAANGDGTNAVTLNGDAGNVLTLAPSPAALTSDQNTAVSFSANVQTSFADTYNLTANAPPGWTVTIDDNGKVTATPAPGTQGGTYSIQVIAQSTTSPDLVAQATVEVTVTPTTPGMTFNVNPDPVFTLPFDGAQVPSAFRATIQNTGSAADTYNLTFSNAPAGFAIVDSGTVDTVPAGQTGILGIYLAPTGSQLPAPGTNVSFTVTATSTTAPSITKTVNVSFTMPAIEAATVTSDPMALSTTPGTATTATITITNVGNVPYNAVLATTTDSGLAISGLSSPGMIPVAQSVTETATLTPDAITPLNTTLNDTVNVVTAPTQSVVSVVSVSAAAAGAALLQNTAGGTPTPQEGFAVAGQSVDVAADVQSAVSQTEHGQASFTVTNSQGNTVFSSAAVPVTLSTIGSMAAVDLGTFSTAGLAPGQYTIHVTIADSGGHAIAGATGAGSLVVALPVSANLSVDSDSQTPGPLTSTETLNFTSNAVLGNVATDSAAQSVAVNPGAPGLAYVANSQDISIVDISNPSSPKVLSTFGSKDINQGGFNLAQVAGGDLVVASQDLTYATAIKVLVYSLANPQSPTLVGSTTVPYDTLIGMTIQGTTAYLSTIGLQYDANGDSVTAQAGELIAVDFSNPAMPTIAGALYNDLPQPLGHDSNVWQAAAVNSQTAYVASSTSTGADVQTGTGRVLIVNTADAGNMSVAGELDIPGTVQAVGIAIDGTHALVVGSSGGWLSPFGNFSNVGLSGNVTLTLLDITNPASPTIIGSTVVTRNTFAAPGAYPAGALQVIDLGNGQFAINGTLSNSSPSMLLVDASNASSLATSNLAVNSEDNGLALANGELFGAAADGMTIYQPAALDTIATTVTVTVPIGGVSIVPNSFSLAPTSTTSGTNTETLTWDLNLTPGANQQITWQSNIANLQQEQVQPVATGATVQFAAPGQTAQTLTLGPLNVAGVPTPVSMTIPVEVAAPGVPAIAGAAVAAEKIGNAGLGGRLNDLGIALTNLVQTPTSAVYLGQALADLDSLITQVTNEPFLSPFTAGLTTGRTALAAATTPADLQTAITNLGTALDSLAQAIIDEAAHGFTLGLTSSSALALPGAPTLFNVALRNTGGATTTYDLSVSGLPAGVTGTFSQPSITLAPGQSIPQGANADVLSLSQSGTSLVGGTFTLTATAEGANEITLSTQGQLTLLAESITVPVVTVTPPFTQPGGQVDVTAKIQSVVNEPHTLSASFTVADATGNVLYTDANPMSVPLTNTSGLTTVDLGNIDTTGFANGVDTVTVTVTDSSSPPSVPATLPTATGQANLTIGLPVSATVSTNPPLLPENTAFNYNAPSTVTTTLSVDAQTTFPNPLTLDGQVQTTPTATDVALYQSGGNNLAYVSGTNGIDIVDVSNPASPVDKGSFGSSDIVKGGVTIGRIATIGGADYLIVGTTATLNANQFTLLIYSLSNPLAPSKVSGTAFDYEFMNDLLVDGTTLLVPTAGLYFFAGGLDDVYGTVLSIDISNPAAPVLKGELYNNRGTPEGGDTQQIGGVIVQSGLAYVTSTTETGGGGFTFNPGVGRVLVVDDSNPASLSVSKEVDLPGTEQAIGIAIQGSQALVISGTGGPTGNQSNYQQASGHLALSLMDISNPASPTLIGNTLITGDTFGTSVSGGDVSVLSLGNGLYAVSGTMSGGKPVLLLVDPTDPNNIVVSASTLPVFGNEMSVSGDVLYATSSQGLTTYQIGSVAHTSYTASVEVPTDANTSIVSGSYNIPPTSITTGANFDTLTWVRQLAFGQDQQTFTWQTQVAVLATNEVRPVTLGTSVSFVNQSTPGSFTMPDTSVTGEQVAEVLPSSATVQPGGTASFDLRLTNPLDRTVDYYLQSFIGSNFTNNVPSIVTMQPNSTVDVPFQVTANLNDNPSTWPVGIGVTGFLPPSDEAPSAESGEANFSITIVGTAVVPDTVAHGVVVTLIPSQASAGLDTTAVYVVRVTNTGSVDDTFNLSLAGLPPLYAAYFSQSAIDVPPGASNFREVMLTLVVDVANTPGDYPFTVTATAYNPSLTATANGTLTILPLGVEVFLTPSSAAPGAPFQLVVYNPGRTSDTFNLSLAGPAALVASLATKSVTLSSGQEQTFDVTTSAVNFADAGPLALTAIATSQTNPAVESAATADLTIPSSQSVTAAFNPPTQTLAAPGATSFLLQVNNTGNSEDSYSATITGASFIGNGGPITASLIGLDGQPAQSVPLFILPGLAQGAILLQVTGAGPGQGTVTVKIQSLTNADENTTATATLIISVPVQMQVVLDANAGLAPVEGTTTPITKSVLEATVPGVGTPAGAIVFTLTSVPTNGSLLLSGQALAAGATFTQDDINSGRLAYQAGEEGADSFGFNVAATGATGASGTFLIATSDPAVAATGGFTVTAAAGSDSANQTVATFSDPGGSEALADYAATIAWGDGTSSAGTITFNTATALFTVTGDHTYASAGTEAVAVTLTHEASPPVTVQSTAVVAAAATHGVSISTNTGLALAEGASATITSGMLQATVPDVTIPAAELVFTLTSVPTNGSLLLSGQALAIGATFTQDDINNGRLAYQAGEEGADSFGFNVAATGATGAGGTFLIATSDPAVAATGGFTLTAAAGTGAASQTVATFSDPGGSEALADYAATIAWGDGTSSAGTVTFNSAASQFTITGDHTYASAGTEAVAVMLTHEASAPVTVQSTAVVSAAGVESLNAVGVEVRGFELSPLTGVTVATFTVAGDNGPAGLSPGTQFSATIGWGDGATSSGTVSLTGTTFTVAGSHTYGDERVWQVSVAITGAGLSANVSTQAKIDEELLPDGTQGTANQRYVQEIYRDVLHREVDQGGLDFWTAKLDAGESHGQLAYDIVRLAFPREEQQDEVQALYETYLHRAPEPEGLQFWTAFLYDGGTDEELAQDLASSPEYLQTRGGGTNDGFLDALYGDALGRAVDAAARTYFDAAMANGATRAAVAALIFGSDEYRRELVSGWYEQFLDRPADSLGVAAFAAQLAAGQSDEQIIAEFVSSDEYFAKTAVE